MANVRQTIVGVFTDTAPAENAIEALHSAGFSNDQIRYSGHAGMGGGFWENMKSLFTGANETSGDVVNDLRSIGLTQDEASYYAQQHKAGHPIVAVNAADRAQDAAQILQTNGGYSYAAGSSAANTAYDQSTAYNQAAYDQRADYTGTERYAQANSYTTGDQYSQSADYAQTNRFDRTADADSGDVATDEERRLRLREERLQADKQAVESGEVNIRKEVVTEQKSIDVPVQREEVYIERRDLGGRESDTPIGQDEAIRVPVREEQVNVTKTPVETGEVKIGKRTVQDTQRVTDTVQREEPRIDRSGDTPMRDATTDDDIGNR